MYATEQLSVQPIYVSTELIPDFKRQTLFKLRLMSPDLMIEKGRNNGTAVEERLFPCNEQVVQDESHVLLDRSFFIECRAESNTLGFGSLCTIMERGDVKGLCAHDA